MNMKVALYARVSTRDQNPGNQKEALIRRARSEGWEFEYFEEQESTRKTRPVKYELYQRLLAGEFEAICVWRLDRWARSTQEASTEIETLYKRKIPFISITESIDLSTASGTLQFNIISAFAQFERDLIRERVLESFFVDKDGITRSKKSGKAVGKRGADKDPRRKSGYLLRWAGKKTSPRKNGLGDTNKNTK
jgi:DNA invertase Pin-like site-specific DNA recombinase